MSTPTQEFIFTWEIENFNLSLLKAGAIFKSPVYKINAFKNLACFLDIRIEENAKHISCILNIVECSTDIMIKFLFKIINSDKELLNSLRSPTLWLNKNQMKGFNTFYEIDKLENVTGPITVECILFLFTSQEDFQCKCRTKIAVNRSVFRWNVKEIESVSWKESKTFSCSSLIDIEISLSGPEDQIRIRKRKGGRYHGLLHVSCRLSLIDIKDIERDSRIYEYVFKPGVENDTWCYPSFLQKSLFEKEKSNYVKNGTFTLTCEFSLTTEESVYCIKEYNKNCLISIHSDEKEDPLIVLQEDIQRMYTNHLQTDIEVRIKNQTFKAHKSLLSARSPVFAAMFEQEMLENQSGIVDISDVDAETMQFFLKFLYSGLIDNLDYESASKLLIVADKYQVSSLKKECSSFLMSILSTVNVCEIAMLANMINDKAMKAYAMDYIASQANVILLSENWSRFIQNDVKLATDILSYVSIHVGTKIAK